MNQSKSTAQVLRKHDTQATDTRCDETQRREALAEDTRQSCERLSAELQAAGVEAPFNSNKTDNNLRTDECLVSDYLFSIRILLDDFTAKIHAIIEGHGFRLVKLSRTSRIAGTPVYAVFMAD